jgi:hypothetical protein
MREAQATRMNPGPHAISAKSALFLAIATKDHNDIYEKSSRAIHPKIERRGDLIT